MRHVSITTALAATAAAIAMAFAVSSASARRIATTESNFLVAWTPTSPLAFSTAGHIIRCPVTIDGSFHSRTLSKVCGQLIGYVNRAIVANSACTNGHFTVLTETLPWHVRYFRFSGTLPEISAIYLYLVGARFQFETAEATRCLFGTTNEHPGAYRVEIEREAEGFLKARTLVWLPEFTIPLGGGFVCSLAGEAHFEGTAAVSGTAVERPAILVTLVQ